MTIPSGPSIQYALTEPGFGDVHRSTESSAGPSTPPPQATSTALVTTLSVVARKPIAGTYQGGAR
jgi:hypothetical protein